MMMVAPMMMVPVVMMVVEARNYMHARDKVLMVVPTKMVMLMSPVMMVLHLHDLIFCRNRRGRQGSGLAG